ncbi:MAG: o-succinylbenzoate synthase [Bernardetiaceae bacterium]|jgi:o-succinylbenzoate synthase|nr:o-succinylbenzoate synthase [Bernardetiaceae bacterium]
MLQLRYQAHTLPFKFEAGTSRGVLTYHRAFYLRLSHAAEGPASEGWGEAAPLPGLSPDHRPEFEAQLAALVQAFNNQQFSAGQLAVYPSGPGGFSPLADFTNALSSPAGQWLRQQTEALPSVRFALETALLDWQHGGEHILSVNSAPVRAFTSGRAGLPINGLVWMGPEATMRQQAEEKIAAGFRCLKFKIGALDFATELALLTDLRRRYPANQLEMRVDANGAFTAAEAPAKLRALAPLGLHSIEQPIKPGQPQALAELCAASPVPIALDEELIGVPPAARAELLASLRPRFIVLKPTLLGGLAETAHWIQLAQQQGIGWWITSALESNVGLNAISQFAAACQPSLPQGLGTGQLYHHNVASPLVVDQGQLFHRPLLGWGSL